MSDTFDHEGDAWDSMRDDDDYPDIYVSRPMRLAKPDLTCRQCKTSVYWQEVIGEDGRPVARLFKSGKPHDCSLLQNNPDGFD